MIDPETAGALRALRRASERAFRLAKATRTPFWVMKNGRIVNLNPDAKGSREARSAATKAARGSAMHAKKAGRAKKNKMVRGTHPTR